MTAHAAHPGAAHGHGAPNSISVGWVIVASILMGLGVLMLAFMLIEFNVLLLSGALVLFVGILMSLDPRMGSDHA
jgi:hypothetical protein